MVRCIGINRMGALYCYIYLLRRISLLGSRGLDQFGYIGYFGYYSMLNLYLILDI